MSSDGRRGSEHQWFSVEISVLLVGPVDEMEKSIVFATVEPFDSKTVEHVVREGTRSVVHVDEIRRRIVETEKTSDLVDRFDELISVELTVVSGQDEMRFSITEDHLADLVNVILGARRPDDDTIESIETVIDEFIEVRSSYAVIPRDLKRVFLFLPFGCRRVNQSLVDIEYDHRYHFRRHMNV
jgi:hypothetical protein